jgi:hypothetical protein
VLIVDARVSMQDVWYRSSSMVRVSFASSVSYRISCKRVGGGREKNCFENVKMAYCTEYFSVAVGMKAQWYHCRR